MRAQPREGRWPVAVRLRLFLKVALRAFRLRRVDIVSHDKPARSDEGPQEETG
jgi:hypothetical protein